LKRQFILSINSREGRKKGKKEGREERRQGRGREEGSDPMILTFPSIPETLRSCI
jgi:hypothetical protein